MFKRLDPADFEVTKYPASKLWQTTSEECSEFFEFHVGADLGERFASELAPRNKSGTAVQAVYDMINHVYYSGNFYERFGVEDIHDIDLGTFPRGDNPLIYVLKISSEIYGTRIFPGSLEISTSIEDESLTLTDDGNGNLLVKGTNDIVGNVFYRNGVLVLTRRPFDQQQPTISSISVWPNYDFKDVMNIEVKEATTFPDYELTVFDNIFRDFEIEFRSDTFNFENEVFATIEPEGFGATANPTISDGDEFVLDERPHVTTVGLYDDQFRLLAIGKLSSPIRTPDTTPMNIVIRFDT